MKGFIEVTTEGGRSILLNVNCIEMISPLSTGGTGGTGGTSINTTSVYSKENWRYDQEIQQSHYFVQESYKEVKAMIEEAMI